LSLRQIAILLAAAFVCIATPAFAQADPNQQAFLAAVSAMQTGQFKRAIAMLDALAARTDAPRVRLELARALYLDGQLKRARSEFLKVYRRPGLPYAVRRTINVFLADIDQRAGFFEPRAGIELNSNPGQIAASGIYQIFGAPLAFDRGKDVASAGLNLDAEFAAPLGDRLSLVGSAAGTLYRTAGASWGAATATLRLPAEGRFGWYGAGASVYRRDQGDTVTTAFVERSRLFQLGHGRELTLHAQGGWEIVRPRAELSGAVLQASAAYGFDLDPVTAVSLMLEGGYASARYAVDRRWSAGGGAQLVRVLPRLNKNLVLGLSSEATVYGDMDPFFGERRRDLVSRLDLTVLNGAPVAGLFPGLRFTYERRDSSIAFYGYDRKSVSFELRRRF
jgi:hypothetical protein